jgi:ribonuclease HI
MLGPDLPDAVAGMSLGADPIVSAVTVSADLHLSRIDGLLVRKEAKTHGTGKRIEGPWRAGIRVVVVEDTSTTGGSALQAADAIKEAGGKVFRVITLIDRQEGAEDKIRDAGLRFDALFRLREIMAPAVAGGAGHNDLPTPFVAAARGGSSPRLQAKPVPSAQSSNSRPRPVILRADGASAGNPGPAGAGYLLCDPAGKELKRGSKYLGVATNNVAEYHALLAGLEAAKEIGATQVTVRMDSELVVKQMRGQYRVKNEGLRPLYEKAKREAAGFTRVVFEAVPREQNKVADSLATAAAAARKGFVNT